MQSTAKRVAAPGSKTVDSINGNDSSDSNHGVYAYSCPGQEKKTNNVREENEKEEKRRQILSKQVSRHRVMDRLEPSKKKKSAKKKVKLDSDMSSVLH